MSSEGSGISLSKILSMGRGKKPAAKKTVAKKTTTGKKKSGEVDLPIRKTFFPNQSLRNVTYSAGSGRTSPDVLQLIGTRGYQLDKEILIYAVASMIGEGRSTLHGRDFDVAVKRMGMNYFSSRS